MRPNEMPLDLQCVLGERVQFFPQRQAHVGACTKEKADLNYEWPFLSLWWQVRKAGAHPGREGWGGGREAGRQLWFSKVASA